MDNIDNDGPVFYETQTHIPLDDAGIYEKRALEAIIATCQQALEYPAKVGGLVFGIVMEDVEKLLTAPNGEKTGSFIAISGAANVEAQILYILINKVKGMAETEPPESV